MGRAPLFSPPVLHGPSKFVYSRNAVCDENVLVSNPLSTNDNQMKLIGTSEDTVDLFGTRTGAILRTEHALALHCALTHRQPRLKLFRE